MYKDTAAYPHPLPLPLYPGKGKVSLCRVQQIPDDTFVDESVSQMLSI